MSYTDYVMNIFVPGLERYRKTFQARLKKKKNKTKKKKKNTGVLSLPSFRRIGILRSYIEFIRKC